MSEDNDKHESNEPKGKPYVNPLDLNHLSVHLMDFYAIIHEYEGPREIHKRKPFEVYHHPV